MSAYSARLLLIGCAILLVGSTPAAGQAVDRPTAVAASDPWLTAPVDDRAFLTLLDLFRYDRELPLQHRVLGTQEQHGIVVEHVSFLSTPGETVYANFYRAPVPGWRERATVLLVHGAGGDGKDAAYVRVAAQELVRAGFNVFTPDLKHFGERKTDLIELFTEQERHERLYNQPSTYMSFVAQTVKDVGRAIDLLIEEYRVGPERIGYVGISRGSILGAIIGGAEKRLRAVVLLVGGHFDAKETGHLAAACPANFIGRIAPRPLLMVNGTRDGIMIRETSVEPLYRLAREPKELLWLEAGHQLPSGDVREHYLAWLRRNLP